MSPTGKGPLNDGPLHPRVPGAPPLGTPCRHAPHSIAGQLPCGAGAPRAICPAECVCAQGSRWHGETKVPLLRVSCAASLWRQLPFGAKRLRVICRLCRQCAQSTRKSGKASVPLTTDILHRIPAPPASLRRKAPPGDLATGMRCAQGSRWHDEARGTTFAPVVTHMPPSKPAYTSTHATRSLNNNAALQSSYQFHTDALLAPERKKSLRGDTQPQPEITAEALRGGSSGVADARRKTREEKAPSLRHASGSLAHIRIPPGRSPAARQRRREAARRKNAVQDNLGVQGRRSPPGTRGGRGCSLQHPCPPEA